MDVSNLFNNTKYSDLIVEVNGVQWHCHRCIVYEASEKLLMMAVPDEHRAGDRIVLKHHDDATAVMLMLRSIYEGDEAILFETGRPTITYVNLCILAAELGNPTMQITAFRALRYAVYQETAAQTLSYCFRVMRDKCSAEIVELVDSLEQQRMHILLLDDATRKELSKKAIKRYIKNRNA